MKFTKKLFEVILLQEELEEAKSGVRVAMKLEDDGDDGYASRAIKEANEHYNDVAHEYRLKIVDVIEELAREFRLTPEKDPLALEDLPF